jgi:hypothetical protein
MLADRNIAYGAANAARASESFKSSSSERRKWWLLRPDGSSNRGLTPTQGLSKERRKRDNAGAVSNSLVGDSASPIDSGGTKLPLCCPAGRLCLLRRRLSRSTLRVLGVGGNHSPGSSPSSSEKPPRAREETTVVEWVLPQQLLHPKLWRVKISRASVAGPDFQKQCATLLQKP